MVAAAAASVRDYGDGIHFGEEFWMRQAVGSIVQSHLGLTSVLQADIGIAPSTRLRSSGAPEHELDPAENKLQFRA